MWRCLCTECSMQNDGTLGNRIFPSVSSRKKGYIVSCISEREITVAHSCCNSISLFVRFITTSCNVVILHCNLLSCSLQGFGLWIDAKEFATWRVYLVTIHRTTLGYTQHVGAMRSVFWENSKIRLSLGICCTLGFFSSAFDKGARHLGVSCGPNPRLKCWTSSKSVGNVQHGDCPVVSSFCFSVMGLGVGRLMLLTPSGDGGSGLPSAHFRRFLFPPSW